MSLCKYKNSLGEPNKGIHKHVLGIALSDLLGTILITLLISKIFKLRFVLVLFIALLLGILLHRLFCVNTTLNKFIFGEV
jgi:hypothetical protein